MPIYEYHCKSCSHRFDLRKHFGENSRACCPKCQSEAYRVFSPVPILFKGPGFYVTDSASKEGVQLRDQRDEEQPVDTDIGTEQVKRKTAIDRK